MNERRSPTAVVAMAVVLALAAAHMLLTATVNMPFPRIKEEVLPGSLADRYVRPLFVQNYRIFAPNPAAEDRQLWVRARVPDDDGGVRETEWINATAVELADPARRVLRKQLTIVTAEAYRAAEQGLLPAQREVVARDFVGPGAHERLATALGAHGGEAAYLRAADSATAYATQVAHALHGDEVVAVQTMVVYAPVPRWESPDIPVPRIEVVAGWREPVEHGSQDRAEFARTFLSWMELAGDRAYAR